MNIKKIRESVQSCRSDIIADAKKLISYPSTEGEEKPGRPFGEKVNACLEETLQIADKLGLKSENIDGYAGTVELGNGEDILGILCHLDVVPAGEDWNYPPFTGVIEDGKLYGRGALDNKGPAVGAMYAMKIVKELGIELNKRVRLILGTNEESGFGGINYYSENEEVPDLAFSPDAVFPVIHAEKGIVVFNLVSHFSAAAGSENNNENVKNRVEIIELEGGTAPNMVPDRCRAKLRGDEELLSRQIEKYVNNKGIKFKLDEGDHFLHLTCHGVSAHGSKPRDGKNAISHLIQFLGELNIKENALSRFCHNYRRLIGLDYHGKKMGCDRSDDISGRLVFNVGQIKADLEKARVTVNIRYPVESDMEKIYDDISKAIDNPGWKLEKQQHKKPLFLEKDDPLVSSLMEVYSQVTGESAEPLAIGGGTYARAVPKAVAFGPLFPGEPELAHQKDEYIEIDSLLENIVIYAGAIIALASSEDLK